MKFPGYYTTNEEEIVSDGSIFELGKKELYENIEDITSRNDWSCDITSLIISRSKKFNIIVRANTIWNINGDIVNAIDIVWMDKSENWGSGNKVLDD